MEHPDIEHPVDVLVVGAGLAGLTAAATARQAGASVLVLDAHTGGGRCRVSTHQGCTFNLGGHALLARGPGGRVLDALGVHPAGPPPPLRRFRLLGGDGALTPLPTGPASLAACGALSLRSKAQLGRLLATLGRIRAPHLAGTSTADWLGRLGLRADAGAVLTALVRLTTYSADLSSLGADAAVAHLQAGARGGVRYLDGGWGPMLDALAAGVEVRHHRRVTSISPTGVTTDDGPVGARTVVAAAGGPAATRALLPDAPDWGELGPPVTAACLDVAVRRAPEPGYVLGLDRPLYVTTQGPPARLAPPGMAVVAGIRYHATSAEADRRDLEAHLRAAGVREGDVVHRRFLARMVVAGTACRPEPGGLAGRPRIGDTGCNGVWMAGDWVGPEGLLADAALASGHAAGRAALARLGT